MCSFTKKASASGGSPGLPTGAPHLDPAVGLRPQTPYRGSAMDPAGGLLSPRPQTSSLHFCPPNNPVRSTPLIRRNTNEFVLARRPTVVHRLSLQEVSNAERRIYELSSIYKYNVLQPNEMQNVYFFVGDAAIKCTGLDIFKLFRLFICESRVPSRTRILQTRSDVKSSL